MAESIESLTQSIKSAIKAHRKLKGLPPRDLIVKEIDGGPHIGKEFGAFYAINDETLEYWRDANIEYTHSQREYVIDNRQHWGTEKTKDSHRFKRGPGRYSKNMAIERTNWRTK